MAIQRQKILNEIGEVLNKEEKRLMTSFVVCELQKDCLVFRMPGGLDILDTVWEKIQEVCKASRVQCRKEGKFATLTELDTILGNVKWLWKNWLPKGSLTLLVGDPGSNKSMIALDLVKIITNGGYWPLTQDWQEPSNVVWLEAESGHQMLRQRAKAMGVFSDKVFLPNFDGDIVAQPDLLSESHQNQLYKVVKATKPELIVIDSLSGINQRGENRIEEVRPIMQFLADLSRDEELSIIMIHHLRKSAPGESLEIELNKVRGSGAIVAFSRSIIGLEKQDTRRTIRHVKGNYAPPQQPIVATPFYEFVVTPEERTSKQYSAYQSAPPKLNKTEECSKWVVAYIRKNQDSEGNVALSKLVEDAKEMKYTRDNIYSAKDYLIDQIAVTGTGNKVYWCLIQDTESIYQVMSSMSVLVGAK